MIQIETYRSKHLLEIIKKNPLKLRQTIYVRFYNISPLKKWILLVIICLFNKTQINFNTNSDSSQNLTATTFNLINFFCYSCFHNIRSLNLFIKAQSINDVLIKKCIMYKYIIWYIETKYWLIIIFFFKIGNIPT